MSFEEREDSAQEGNIANLFLITYGSGSGDYFAYTDWDRPITFDSKDYEAIPITRAAVDSEASLDETPFIVQMSPLASFVDYMQTRVPARRVSLVIRQGHFDDPDAEYPVVWTGRVVLMERKPTYVELSCESIVTALRKIGLRRNYQRQCPYSLYEPPCNATRTVQVTRTPTQVGDHLFAVPTGWNGALPREKFKGGYVRWTDPDTNVTHSRTIIDIVDPSQTTDNVIVQGVLEGLTTSISVQFFAGCNHMLSDCRDLHDNLLNFGGQPLIPQENPVAFTNRYF